MEIAAYVIGAAGPLKGKTIFAPVELHQNDILTIGATRLIFLPLCGEAFSWGKES